MIGARQVRRIAVIGLLMGMVWASGLWAQDAALRMIPADSLFCVRINNLDQTLVQVDQFLAGVSPINVGMMAKMQLGRVLRNPMLAGVKTDGTLAVFAVPPGGEVKSPTGIAKGLSLLLAVSDYSQFTASSEVGEADPNGVSALKGAGLYVAHVDGYALIGQSASAGAFAARAQSLKARAALSLAGTLDADELATATKEPMWIYGNAQFLASAVSRNVP